METSEIRDRLLEQRALYQQSLQTVETEARKIREIIGGITESEKDVLKQVLNEDYYDLETFDLERMKSDGEYLAYCQGVLDGMIRALHKYLEDKLSV